MAVERPRLCALFAVAMVPLALASNVRFVGGNWGADRRIKIDNIPNSYRHQLFNYRGGAKSETSARTKASKKISKKKAKKKNKNQSAAKNNENSRSSSTKDNKEKIAQALEEDPASKLGDAIRDRADQILASPGDGEASDRQRRRNPLLDQIDDTVSSVGFALGASDRFATLLDEETEDETGGVEAATTAVLVHYFLKSHGGAHAVQCLLSLLASLSGTSAIALPFVPSPKQAEGTPSVSELCLVLIKRCMIFAMMKHLSGLFGASVVTAKLIPQVGLRNARGRIHELVQNPVSQYVFYTASVLWWLGAKSSNTLPSWWQNLKTVPLVLVGPVLLREWISSMLVISDVLVLWVCTNRQNSEKEAQQKGAILLIEKLLKVSQAAINAMMSLLVTPKVWRPANAMKRQEILAKLTSRTSLAMEVLVGLIMSADFMYLLASKIFLGSGSGTADASTTGTAVSMSQIFKTGLCAQLYLQFLWVRRKKIAKMATKLRGGATKMPVYLLDVLLKPAESLGFEQTNKKKQKKSKPKSTKLTWRDAVITGLGFD